MGPLSSLFLFVVCRNVTLCSWILSVSMRNFMLLSNVINRNATRFKNVLILHIPWNQLALPLWEFSTTIDTYETHLRWWNMFVVYTSWSAEWCFAISFISFFPRRSACQKAPQANAVLLKHWSCTSHFFLSFPQTRWFDRFHEPGY